MFFVTFLLVIIGWWLSNAGFYIAIVHEKTSGSWLLLVFFLAITARGDQYLQAVVVLVGGYQNRSDRNGWV